MFDKKKRKIRNRSLVVFTMLLNHERSIKFIVWNSWPLFIIKKILCINKLFLCFHVCVCVFFLLLLFALWGEAHLSICLWIQVGLFYVFWWNTQEQEFDKGCILNVYEKFSEILRWEGTRRKEGEEKGRVERITRPCDWLKKRFEKLTTTRKGFACMKCKGRIEEKKRWKEKKKD